MRQALTLATARARRAPAAEAAPTLLCFSHLRWNFVYQRPQHLLSRAAAAGFRVVMMEEPVEASGGTLPRLDLHEQPGGVTVAVPVVPRGASRDDLEAALRDMAEELASAAPGKLVTWFYTPMALGFAAGIEADVCVYDCMDELSSFRGAPAELVELEADLFGRADLVFTGGRTLYEAKRARHLSVHAFPSSIDKAHFAKARGAAREPADQARLDGVRIGYFGVIDERMDLGLVADAARLRPDWSFVMIGPVVKIAADDLPQADNLHWLGPRRYDELPAYLSGWDAGFMPFALNESTRFISPTKTPEFLAAGVPVVSTAVRDVVRPYGERGLVGIADGPADLVAKADAAMTRPYAAWLAEVDAFLAGMSWDETWGAMHALIAERLGAARPSTAASVGRADARAGGALHV